MYTDDQLKAFIKGEVQGDVYPYCEKSEEAVEAYLRKLYGRIKGIPGLICEAEFDHFGSGYASFVEFFCYRKEDVRINREREKYGILEYEKTGVLINVSRLAPVFIYGEDERYETVRAETGEVLGGGASPLPGQTNIFQVNQVLDRVLGQLFKVLEEFSFQPLDPTYALGRLPFTTQIPTLYREAYEYRNLDALFYWED